MSKRPMDTRIYQTMEDWIQQEMIPFSLTLPETLKDAIDKLMGSIGDSVKLLGFGEALHGGEEFLILRNLLFQRLVEAYGFSAIAVESSFPKAYHVNDYILGNTSSSYDTIQSNGFSPGLGRFEANRELVEWMRNYNSDSAHRTKLHFYGFDSPTELMYTDSPRQLLYSVLNYLSSVDPSTSDAYQKRIDELIGLDSSWENPAAMMDAEESIGLSPEANALRIETENLITELTIHRPEYVARSDKNSYSKALQFASEARQLLNYHAELATPSDKRIMRGLGLRDAIMVDNLQYIVSCERNRGKVLVFAHNSHLKTGKTEWQQGPQLQTWWPAGAHLREIFDKEYVVIGTGLGISEENGIAQPETATLESLLAQSTDAAQFIPTYHGKRLTTSVIESLRSRSGSHMNHSYFPLTQESFTEFDWFCIINSVTYLRGAPSLSS